MSATRPTPRAPQLMDLRGGWDEGLCDLFGVPRAALPEIVDCAGPIGITLPDHFGRADPDLRHGRRPAGRGDRPGLFRPGRDQGDLRHRRVHPDPCRRRPANLGQPPAIDRRVAARRRTPLRARRLVVRRRTGDPVAARRAWADRFVRRMRGPCARRYRTVAGSSSCPASPASARRIGTASARRDPRPDAGLRRAPTSSAPHWKRSPTRAPNFSAPSPPTASTGRGSASTAAWRPMISSPRTSPICSMSRSSAPPMSKVARSARRCSPRSASGVHGSLEAAASAMRGEGEVIRSRHERGQAQRAAREVG